MTQRTALLHPRALSLALSLALTSSWVAAQSISVPNSGQLLQEATPSTRPVQAGLPGLTITRPQTGQPGSDIAFAVQGIEITGNTLLPTAVLQPLVASGEGKNLTLTQLDALAARITEAYQAQGYLLALAYIPEQTLQDGRVRIAVLEARYGAVVLKNKSSVSDRLLSATMSPLQAGVPVTQGGLDRSLLLLSEIPSAVVNATLRPGTALGSSDLDVEVSSGAPYNGALTLDGYGNRYTGRERLNGTINLNNPLHLGDLLTLNTMSSGAGLNYGRLGYNLPVLDQATVLGVQVSTLKYQLGGSLSALQAHGTAQTAGLSLDHALVRSLTRNLTGRLSYSRARLQDDIDVNLLKTGRHTQAWSATLLGDSRYQNGVTNFNLGLSWGRMGFGDAAAEASDAVGANTRGNYSKMTLALSRLQDMGGSNAMYIAFNAQAASTNLDSSEQFFLGGPNSVRAYDVGAANGAQGGLLTTEWRHNLNTASPGMWQATAFVDMGRLQIHKTPFASGPNFVTLAGLGLGLNWFGPNGWTANAALATPVGSVPELVGPSASTRLWLQVRKGF